MASTVIKVDVRQPVTMEALTGPDWVCSGEGATLTAAATGEGTLSYAWSRSADGTNFTPIAGAAGASLATGPLTAPTWFKVEVSSETCGPAGMIKSIGIGAAPVISTPPANAMVQAGQTTTLSVSGTGTAPLSFQWYQGESGDTAGPAAGATAAEFTPPPPAATTRYWVRVSNACGAADSPAATLSVNHRPVIGTVTVPAEVLVNTPAFMSVTASDPDGDTPVYNWYIGTYHYSGSPGITHTFASTGDKVVEIAVSDGKGASTVVDVPVRVVANAAPAFQSVSIPATGATGETLSFSATAADPDGDPITFLWNFGDGSTGQGNPATHAYTAPGSFTVRVEARDKWGWDDTRTGTVTVSGNAYPVIQSASIPGHRTAGSTVTFSITATDPDGDALAYAWDFGDGTAATGSTVTHVYPAEGTYTVRVDITDARGAKVSRTGPLTVGPNLPPTISEFHLPAKVRWHITGVDPYYVQATDPEEDALSYRWDFGDGCTGNVPGLRHWYTRLGTYTVTVTVTDANGASAVRSGTVQVTENQLPVFQSVQIPATVRVGVSVTFTASAADPDGDPVYYRWESGDGTVRPYNNTATSVAFTYARPGTYDVYCTAADLENGSRTHHAVITVTDPDAPVVSAESIPRTAVRGVVTPFSVQASDPSGGPLTVTWDFGDGTAPESGVNLTAVSHTYTAYGVRRTVSVTLQGAAGERTLERDVEVLGQGGDLVNIPDAAFKTVLTARYDTSADGQISYAEAAAAGGTLSLSTSNSPTTRSSPACPGCRRG